MLIKACLVLGQDRYSVEIDLLFRLVAPKVRMSALD